MLYVLLRLREILESEGDSAALRYAAKLKGSVLGEYRDIIQVGYSAKTNPDFYRQLGIDAKEAETASLEAIRKLVS